MVSQLDTCIEESESFGIGLRSRVNGHESHLAAVGRGNLDKRYVCCVVLETIIQAVVTVNTQSERVTALECPLVAQFSAQHDVDGELVSVIGVLDSVLVLCQHTGDNLIGHRNTNLLEVRVNLRILVIGDLLRERCINRQHDFRSDIEEESFLRDEGEHNRNLHLDLSVVLFHLVCMDCIVDMHGESGVGVIQIGSIRMYSCLHTTLGVTDACADDKTEVYGAHVVCPVVCILDIEHYVSTAGPVTLFQVMEERRSTTAQTDREAVIFAFILLFRRMDGVTLGQLCFTGKSPDSTPLSYSCKRLCCSNKSIFQCI